VSLAADDLPPALVCKYHPRRETGLRCNKCGQPICTQCIVQTPVGARCKDCAQLKKLPQYEVGFSLLAPSALAGLGASLVGWYLASFVPFLRFFVGIFVGVAISEAMSRFAKRRSNTVLETIAVIVTVIGFFVAELARRDGNVQRLLRAFDHGPNVIVFWLFPLAIAAVIAVIRLRR
jgi:uncharacterized membrane protein YoaK (UPF0700 family)